MSAMRQPASLPAPFPLTYRAAWAGCRHNIQCFPGIDRSRTRTSPGTCATASNSLVVPSESLQDDEARSIEIVVKIRARQLGSSIGENSLRRSVADAIAATRTHWCEVYPRSPPRREEAARCTCIDDPERLSFRAHPTSLRWRGARPLSGGRSFLGASS
jgi:hypothetical protein